MTRASFPEIPQVALKSHAQPERVERVWRRLELDLSRTPRSGRLLTWWLPVVSVGAAVFGLGVLVGVRLHAPGVELAATAEPPHALALPGAGPAAEPETKAAERRDVPTQKHARSPRVLPTGEVAADYADSYAEPAGPVASEPAPVMAGPADWEKLAEAGDFTGAKTALDREGGFEPVSRRASASQLLVLADIARTAGNREQATQALRRVLTAYVSAPEAPLAAWTLGNLLEQAGDRSGADDAYATYRRLSPTGDFAEDAAARQVDAALSQGNLELGTRAMDEYTQNFPKGRHLAELRKRLSALATPAGATGTPGADTDDDDDGTEPSADAPAPPPTAQH
jgi:hypothetical protein